MDLKEIPDEILLSAKKDLAEAYARALIEETKNPNDTKAKNSVKKYKNELEKFKFEIFKRKLN